MKYRVWHNCQIGKVKNFYVDVRNEQEAWLVLNTLWDYDLFQYYNRVKGDYANASGFEYFDEEENDWCEWYDEEGLDIREHFESLEE